MLKERKTLLVFTSIRSEYGLLSPVLAAIRQSEIFDLRLVVAGAHLLDSYGHTIDEINKDGFTISGLMPFMSENEKENTYPAMLTRLHQQFGSYLEKNPPDLLMVLGDRFELLPVVTTSLLFNIPIAHISGGEFTEGAVDNQIRHAISKIAHIHFPATEVYKDNLIRMGEEEWRICVSGEPGIDQILKTKPLPKSQLFELLGLDIDRPVICCTFHPETISNIITGDFVRDCLIALSKTTGKQILVTASNFDHGGAEINRTLEQLAVENPNIVYHKSLGQLKYYSLLRYADAMVGNSSSGLVEAKSFNLPVVNVGDRQKGRLANANVLHCRAHVKDILKTLSEAASAEFRWRFEKLPNIYGDGSASKKIVSFLHNVSWEKLLVKKNVY